MESRVRSDFTTEYSGRSDDELLLLASDRASLTTEAAAALDAELRRRNLSESDQAKHQQFVKRNEQREARRRQRKIFGTRSGRSKWVDVFWTSLAIALISFTYLALPSRYHMRPDWQEAAVHVMFASVFIAVVGSSWSRKIGFWMSLLLSTAVHMFVVHAWIQRIGHLSRGQGKLAILLGLALFFVVYGFVSLLRRNFYGTEASDDK
jgi:hypothetical protein